MKGKKSMKLRQWKITFKFTKLINRFQVLLKKKFFEKLQFPLHLLFQIFYCHLFEVHCFSRFKYHLVFQPDALSQHQVNCFLLFWLCEEVVNLLLFGFQVVVNTSLHSLRRVF
jgi:hypothetical protein